LKSGDFYALLIALRVTLIIISSLKCEGLIYPYQVEKIFGL